jgi:hydrogenase nickel incorporation protein HypA/HybF
MHELSITRNLVAIVAEAAAGRRVRRVTLAIGRLSGVMSEAVAFCFDVVAAGTPLAGAVLAIETIDGQARCRECAGEYALPVRRALARDPARRGAADPDLRGRGAALNARSGGAPRNPPSWPQDSNVAPGRIGCRISYLPRTTSSRSCRRRGRCGA